MIRKRKIDLIYEESEYYEKKTIEKAVSHREILPLEWINGMIDFQYYDLWLVYFPSNLLDPLVKLILSYNCLNVELEKRASSKANLCCVCGKISQLHPHDVRCSRCFCFFCNFCWSESNCIPDPKHRMLTFGEENSSCPLKLCIYVEYEYCPGCCCGLKFLH